jgi:RNA polymerase sigma-70 factor, ECF subfamily
VHAGLAEFIDRVRKGDREATERFVRTHNRVLYRTARAILRDEAEAEDAVQEAYLHAIPALGAFRGESSLSTWLVRIVANIALMRRRRLARSRKVVTVDFDLAARALDVWQDPAPGPERAAHDAQARRRVEAAIDGLPEPYRVAFVMREVEELGVDETAVILGIPPATVRTRCFRARALLREKLAEDIPSLGEVFPFGGDNCRRVARGVVEALRLAD